MVSYMYVQSMLRLGPRMRLPQDKMNKTTRGNKDGGGIVSRLNSHSQKAFRHCNCS
jgi:hypothetical protein